MLAALFGRSGARIFDTFRHDGVKFTINTDGPEMLKTYVRDELAMLGRMVILAVEEQVQVAEWARAASFVSSVSNLPPPNRTPAARRKIEREEP